MKKLALYVLRWECSTPVLALCMWLLGGVNIVVATVVANFIGALIFFPVDKLILGGKK